MTKHHIHVQSHAYYVAFIGRRVLQNEQNNPLWGTYIFMFWVITLWIGMISVATAVSN